MRSALRTVTRGHTAMGLSISRHTAGYIKLEDEADIEANDRRGAACTVYLYGVFAV